MSWPRHRFAAKWGAEWVKQLLDGYNPFAAYLKMIDEVVERPDLVGLHRPM